MGAMTARALRNASLTLGEKLSMLTGLILVELIDGQQRLASLHVLDVTVAAATRPRDRERRKLALVIGACALGEIAIVLRGIPAMTYLAPNPGPCVNVVLPQLGHFVFGCEVAREALSSWEIIDAGIDWKVVCPGIDWKIVGPGIGAQRCARQNESCCRDLRHAANPT
jgi:hypothetical protein